MKPETDERTYAIVKPCGCLSAAAVVKHNEKKIAKEISKWVAAGENVQQVTVDFVRQSKWRCEKCSKPEAP